MKTNLMPTQKELRAMWFGWWVSCLNKRKELFWYQWIADFAKEHGLEIAIGYKGKFNSKENFELYFTENILPLCENGIMLKNHELRKLGHYWWAQALYRISGYKSIKKFARAHWLSETQFNTKDKLDKYFNEKIRKHCKDGRIIGSKELNSLWFRSWLASIYSMSDIHWYSWIDDFALKNGLNPYRAWCGPLTWSQFNTKEKIESYFFEKIHKHCAGNKMIGCAELVTLWFGSWLRSLYKMTNLHGYDWVSDFAIKNWITIGNWGFRKKRSVKLSRT